MVLWSIWRSRNDKIWKSISNSARSAVYSALDFLCNWLEARNQHQDTLSTYSNSVTEHRWRKPYHPAFKCNLDAALILQENSVGMGMVLRDSSGSFVACKTLISPGLYAPREAEAASLYEAITWVTSMGVRNVIFESDAKAVVDSVYGITRNLGQ
ncbi:hypothetical protein DITRI_Ditri19aG0031800 [Diplodiscus trichospermus]